MWKHIAQSLQGPSHATEGAACQDSHLVRLLGNEPHKTIIACAADGAGSAKRSDLGSALVCETIADIAAGYFDANKSFESLSFDEVLKWCERVRETLRSTADSNGGKLRDYATTLCVAILSPTNSIFFQIGDGAITVGNDGIYGVVFWPQSGEYVNVTNFVTSENYQDKLEFQVTSNRFTDLALFTDGIERLALNFENQTPHLPFFQPLFQAIRTNGNDTDLGSDLKQFLQSDSVNSRSDDDKTLILATRLAEKNIGVNHAAD